MTNAKFNKNPNEDEGNKVKLILRWLSPKRKVKAANPSKTITKRVNIFGGSILWDGAVV